MGVTAELLRTQEIVEEQKKVVESLISQRTDLQIELGEATQTIARLKDDIARLLEQTRKQDAALRAFSHGYMETLSERLVALVAALGEKQ